MGNAQNRERLGSGSSGSPGFRGNTGDRRRRHSSQQEGCPVTIPVRSCGVDATALLPAPPGIGEPNVRCTEAPPSFSSAADLDPDAQTSPDDAVGDSDTWQLADPCEPCSRRLALVVQWRHGGDRALLSGSFNRWRCLHMQCCRIKDEVEFMAIVNLPVGEHEFVFCVDGKWLVDNDQPSRISATTGKLVNYTQVSADDFRAMEELNDDLTSGRDAFSSSPPGDYGQEMPDRAVGAARRHLSPPSLPPYLLNVILNQPTTSACEPTLLPAPSHVMLNHLYALSIRDGVMVVSATHRYRKKYVTTLLYKAI